jgi:hypothetical protein
MTEENMVRRLCFQFGAAQGERWRVKASDGWTRKPFEIRAVWRYELTDEPEEAQEPPKRAETRRMDRLQLEPERPRRGDKAVEITFARDGEQTQTMHVRADTKAAELTKLLMERLEITGTGYLEVWWNGKTGSYAISEEARYETSA